MILKVYAVYDVGVSAFRMPHFARAKGEAIRNFMSACNDRNTDLFASPKDFTLFEIGEYDDQTGRFENYQAPVPLGAALEFKENVNAISDGPSVLSGAESRDSAQPLRS